MKRFELPLPTGADQKQIIDVFETLVMHLGLTVASRGTLKTLPGSVHWHLKKGSESGTLEATLQFDEQNFRMSYHENRQASWFNEAIPRIREGWNDLSDKCG